LFSKTAWTLPDMASVNEEFNREYDPGEYERKIAKLIRSIQRELLLDKEGARAWDKAVALSARRIITCSY
jgi:hypothetical protein